MALMFGAAMLMPCLDAGAKILGQTLSPAQVALFRFGVQTVLLAAILRAFGRPVLVRAPRTLARLALGGVFMTGATFALFWGLQYLPLANAIVLLFVAPLFLTLFSAWFLGERVGPHRYGAVVVGLLGAVIVIRPNFWAFGLAAILPLIAAASFAALMCLLRLVRGEVDGFRTQLTTGAFSGLYVGVAVAIGTVFGAPPLTFVDPPAALWPLILLVGTVGIIGQAMMTFAARFAETSLIAPFQYFEIFSATLLGIVLFNEFPDEMTLLGGGVILTAGLYTIHRERVRQRARRAAPLG
ncbi:MAG: DMT family transporter [Pseudomonadota bacterium]